MNRLTCLLFLAAAALSRADLSYTVHVLPDQQNLHVTLKISNTTGGVKLQMPNWAPGSYRLSDGYKNVKNLKAMDDVGTALKIDTVMEKLSKMYGDGADRKTVENDLCTWVVAPAKTTTVEYDITSNVVDGAVHWSGPSTYIYPVGRTQEHCVLDLRLPDGWKAYLGLIERRGQDNVYDANTYDVLADNPVSTGDLLVDTYVVQGKTHYIAMRGKAKEGVDREHLIKACKFVTTAEADLFGGIPYDHYVWHFAVNDQQDGAGGLEHLASTEIGLAKGVGPRAVGVLFHEFFHLWNVKRIRSRPLGPFDYTKLPATGAIWWLEGVTDYYAHTLPFRDSWWGEDAYFRDIASNVNIVRNNSARLEVSPYDSSYRVDEASGGRGNSNGYRESYYNMGWVCGMILDIELRDRTGGKKTLDDVEIGLWNLCRDDRPGFEEDEIRRQLVKVGGYEMGPFYDSLIMKPGEVPVEAALAKVGLRFVEKDESFVDVGFATNPGLDGIQVARPSGPGADKLKSGDFIVGIDGKMLNGTRQENGRTVAGALAAAKVGTPLKLSVKRGDQTIDVEIVPVQSTRKVKTVEHDPNATAAQKALGASWLAQKKL